MTQRTDRELLELAAKAAGYRIYEYGVLVGGDPCLVLREADFTGMWAPITDDGDALRLAVKLTMYLEFGDSSSLAKAIGVSVVLIKHDADPCNGDVNAAARRAIVRAAAEIGAAL